MSRRRPRLLVVGDAVAATGFARVIHSVLAPLAERYEICQLGCNYWGDPHVWPWPIYPAGSGPRGDWTGQDRLASMVASFQPDLIFLANDLHVVAHQLSGLSSECRIPIVANGAVNAEPLDADVLPRLSKLRHLVLYTEFARSALERARSQCGDGASGLEGLEVSVLPNGVDQDVFHPLAEDRATSRRLARQRLYGDASPQADALIVLNANRNRPHKCIDVTLRGFAASVKDRGEDTYLHLHMGCRELGWDLQGLARRLGISDRLILTSPAAGHPQIDTDHLNCIYNSADIGINTSWAEGWGLISFEHGATGAAQVVPDHTGVAELWKGAALTLKPKLKLIDPSTGQHQHLIAVESVAAALRSLYDDAAYRHRMANEALANATQETYTWSHIVPRWQRVFDRCLRAGGAP